MRKGCYDCVKKHLGSAGVFIKETKLGYPDYEIWVLGELEHAADESLEKNQELAQVIREHRLSWYENRKHIIPFEALNRYINCCIMAEQEGIDCPAVPEDAMEGLERADGVLLTHGDTRP